ncbi:MAG TPA: hypothetical protein VMW87_02780 [Spirochaetia bacterium]|nr:hypothetical protein [Spirochaetia bacterium]
MEHPISSFIVEYFNWVFLGVLALNLFQRRRGKEAHNKRFATLYIAIFVFLIYTFANSIVYFKWSEWLLLPFGVVTLTAGVLLRKWVFPFRFRCPSCEKTLSFEQIIYRDSNFCDDCTPAVEPPAGDEGQSVDSTAEDRDTGIAGRLSRGLSGLFRRR